jgi:rSAM/selenodomain-associated transferase 2
MLGTGTASASRAGARGSPELLIFHPPGIDVSLSVVIPTLNEAERIGPLISATRDVGECEIVVVDGGSTDATRDYAAGADRVLSTPRGRAVQQNAGAAASSGDVLLFLHADCRLQPGAFEAVTVALQDARAVGGCFRQRIDAAGWRYRLLERGNALRVKLWNWAYGDQGIFVRRDVFVELGGFPELKLMEDLYLMKRLKKRGRIIQVTPPLIVSPRRWQQTGILRQTLRNWTLLALAGCGVSPNRLARFYPHVR